MRLGQVPVLNRFHDSNQDLQLKTNYSEHKHFWLNCPEQKTYSIVCDLTTIWPHGFALVQNQEMVYILVS